MTAKQYRDAIQALGMSQARAAQFFKIYDQTSRRWRSANPKFRRPLPCCCDDSAEAIRELQAIGKRRWPGLTPHQQLARAMETNSDLATRARTSGGGRRRCPRSRDSNRASRCVWTERAAGE